MLSHNSSKLETVRGVFIPVWHVLTKNYLFQLYCNISYHEKVFLVSINYFHKSVVQLNQNFFLTPYDIFSKTSSNGVLNYCRFECLYLLRFAVSKWNVVSKMNYLYIHLSTNYAFIYMVDCYLYCLLHVEEISLYDHLWHW